MRGKLIKTNAVLFTLLRFVFKSKLFRLSAVGTVILALYIGGLHLNDNFHEVIPDELYRSGQLEDGELTEIAKKYGIKSVLNLRGDNTGSSWYDNEVIEAKQNGVSHLNFRMSSKRELTSGQVSELIAMMRNAPKPMLIHCQGGADRSGLATALYMDAISKAEPDEAEKHLSLLYGHFPSLGTDKMCLTYNSTKMSISPES